MESIKDRIFTFDGKVALITGAAGGFGLSISEAFAELGATVIMVDMAEDRLTAACNAITKLGRKATCVVADVTQAADVAIVAKEVEQRFGRLNILVNNVGATLGVRKSFAETPPEEWEKLYRVNLWNMFAVTQSVLPFLKKGGRGGSVINVSTIEAFRAFPLSTVYVAFKAAVTGFTTSLACELGPDGIRVNAIAPETADSWSNDYRRWLPKDEESQIGCWVPLGRFGTSGDAAGCAVFLASELSGWVTGTTVHMDGGCLAAAGWVRTQEGQWTHRPTIEGTRWPPVPNEREFLRDKQ